MTTPADHATVLEREHGEALEQITQAWAALNAAGLYGATAGIAELIGRLAAERDKLVETVGRMISLPPHLVAEAYGVTYTGEVQP